MTGMVLTEVAAEVAPGRAAEVVPAFTALLRTGLPDGLLRTELLEGPAGLWRIQSLWRDQEALDAMRAGSAPPAAPTLFRRLGAEPTLTVLRVQGSSGG
jgi:quinol monooxygenase YgiN